VFPSARRRNPLQMPGGQHRWERTGDWYWWANRFHPGSQLGPTGVLAGTERVGLGVGTH
jgi:hypothetical protein